MKNIALFTISFLMLSNLAHATDSLRAYYATVAKAEWAAGENDFSLAASLYKEAFSYKVKPFYLDLCQALGCELQLDDLDTTTCENYFKQILLKQGWCAVDRIDMESFMNRYKSDRLGVNFEKLIDRYFSSDTSALQYQIMLIYDEDQGVRRKSKAWLDTCNKNIIRTDSINNLKVIELLQIHPEILDENVVGFSCVSHIDLVLLHYTNISFDDEGYVLQAVKDGIFDARRYAWLFDRYYGSVLVRNDSIPNGVSSGDYYGTWNLDNFVDLNGNLFSIIYTDERNRIVKNSRRSEIFLGDVLDYSYRTFYRQNLKDFRRARKDIFPIDKLVDDFINSYKNSNIQFDYYIPNEKDFDFNFKRAK